MGFLEAILTEREKPTACFVDIRYIWLLRGKPDSLYKTVANKIPFLKLICLLLAQFVICAQEGKKNILTAQYLRISNEQESIL